MKARAGRGPLVIIGGREAKDEEPAILGEFLRLAGGRDGRIVVMTVATELPEELGAIYTDVFTRLGAAEVRVVDVRKREDAHAPEALGAIKEATGVFFTGGSQLRITTLLGGSPIDTLLHECHDAGMVLAGTSSGASMMSATMIIQGEARTSPTSTMVKMSHGMNFIDGPIIDQHFAQRGRIGRLLSAVASHPAQLGLGIDEDTALVVEGDEFRVIGAGAVTVVDASDMTYTNLDGDSDGDGEGGNLALFGVRLHILPAGCRFDLVKRIPAIEGE